MKRKVIAIAAFLALGATAAMAQGLYVGAEAGYGLPIGSDQLGTTTTTDVSNGEVTTEAIYGTLGGGINAGINVGYMFGEHVGADVGFNYLMGSKVTIDDVQATGADDFLTTEAYTRQMRVNPGIMATTANEEGEPLCACRSYHSSRRYHLW